MKHSFERFEKVIKQPTDKLFGILIVAAHFPGSCKSEVRWMFQHLDLDADDQLSLQELYDLEHDQSEKCIKPFLDACDADHDIFVSPHEWCHCFEKTDRPCAAVKRRISPDLLGKCNITRGTTAEVLILITILFPCYVLYSQN